MGAPLCCAFFRHLALRELTMVSTGKQAEAMHLAGRLLCCGVTRAVNVHTLVPGDSKSVSRADDELA